MISDDRKEELQYQIRNKIPIRMTDSTEDSRLKSEILHTGIFIDLSDLYTLRDLVEADIISFGPLTIVEGGYTIETTFYETLKITNDEGMTIDIQQGETIHIAVEQKIVEDLHHYIG